MGWRDLACLPGWVGKPFLSLDLCFAICIAIDMKKGRLGAFPAPTILKAMTLQAREQGVGRERGRTVPVPDEGGESLPPAGRFL